jgi:hypothetical protein
VHFDDVVDPGDFLTRRKAALVTVKVAIVGDRTRSSLGSRVYGL